MTWSLETSNGMESAKIAHLAVPYLQGKGVDVGCGPNKVWPSAIGIDSLKDYGGQRLPSVDMVCNAENLDLFADQSLDYVYSSHFLEHTVDFKAVLREWWRVIKPGGHLVLYLPHKLHYPNMGQPGSNPDHKHDFMPEDIINAMKEIGSWELLENEDRSRWNEYSFYQVFKKKQGKGRHLFKVWQRNPKGRQRCLVIRYGAIGDALMVSSILPELKKQGYFITFQCAPKTKDVLREDPNVDEWFVQEENFVPNVELGPYWKQLQLEGRWDRIINLCESVEAGLLALPDRLQHNYPEETRRKLFNVNYLERTHDIAGVPHEFHPKFYPTQEETDWARRTINSVDAPVIAWAITGSSIHKVYPYIHTVLAWIARHTPTHVYLLGDERAGRELEDGIMACLTKDGIDTTRIHPVCGKWSVRQSLTFAQQAHLVVGPETGVLNAVGMEDVNKVIYLSHSSPENLTKYWRNAIVLEPDRAKAPCWPCHRMIYTWDSCVQNESTKAAACASSITAERVFEAILSSLGMTRQHDTPPSGTSGMRRAA